MNDPDRGVDQRSSTRQPANKSTFLVFVAEPVSREWGNAVVGRCWRQFEAINLVSKDWGKVAVGRCWRHSEKRPKPSSFDVKSLVGIAGADMKQP